MPDRSIIAAGHPLAAEGAVHAIQAGGNAIDGAVAGWLVSCLAEPVLTSPGGGGFAMVAPAGGRVRLYDFFTQTPLAKRTDAKIYPLEADFGSTRQVFHLGAGSVATPGCVAGILKMHEDLGRLPLRECAAPAMDLARNGLTITDHAAKLLQVVSELYTATPGAKAIFGSRIHSGGCMTEGETYQNQAFEGFLEMLVAEGSRWFYEGDIGRMVGAFCEANGGHLRREDFRAYKPQIRDPLEIRHHGATVRLNPPPSMGGTLIALGLSMNGESVLPGYPFQDLSHWKDWINCLRVMSLVRTSGGFASLSEAERKRLEAAGAANSALGRAMHSLFPHAFPQARSQGTTQLSIMDDSGNEISMTTSNGAGSAIILPGTGFMLNNMLGEEDLQPEGVGSWRENERLASMMCPTLVELPGGRRVATGSGGSNRIRSTLLQILRHLIDRGVPIEDAVSAPRLHWENGEVHVEREAAEAIASLPGKLPWPLIAHEVPNLFFGGAHSVSARETGAFSGMADPRRGGVVVQVRGGGHIRKTDQNW